MLVHKGRTRFSIDLDRNLKFRSSDGVQIYRPLCFANLDRIRLFGIFLVVRVVVFFNSVECRKLCIFKPKTSRLSSYLIHWNISDASLGTEELGHLEMIAAIVHQLTRKMTPEEIKKAGFDAYFVDHTAGVYPQFASGTPWTAATMQVKGDVITDLSEDMAAEQKARTTYDNILRLSDDPDVNDVIKFLREREIVHYQRFGEGLRNAIEKLDSKNFYAVNPAFD